MVIRFTATCAIRFGLVYGA